MLKRIAIGTAEGLSVTITAEIDTTLPLRDDAENRIAMVLRREAERIAQIAFVDIRDAAAEVVETQRLRGVPKDRPHIIVAAGSKDPANVSVEQGSYEVMGRTVSAKKGAK